MTSDGEHKPKHSREEIGIYVHALPATDTQDGSLVDLQATDETFVDLNHSGSAIPRHIEEQADSVTDEVIDELEEVPDENQTFVITRDALHGVVARAARRGAAQAVTDVGNALHVTSEIERMLEDIQGTDEAAS